MEGLLSDRRRPGNRPAGADGGDSPAWSTKRAPYVPPVIERPAGAVPYAELHAHSSFSFLDGASSPEELAEEAASRASLERAAAASPARVPQRPLAWVYENYSERRAILYST